MAFQTEVDFVLPKGFMDDDGTLHKEGRMRLATAADEILPMKDPRVQQNPAYLTVIVLARVIVKLGTVANIHPGIVEKLYASDISYLQQLYQTLNDEGKPAIQTVCPTCDEKLAVGVNGSGELWPVTP